jgi:chromosome segregation protein
VLDGFGKSLEVILPKLRDGYIVPDPGTGRGLALENPNAFFLSQSGECFHNVTVTGGKQRAEGPLSMKRELREVMRLLEDLERALQDGEMRVLTLGREIKDLSSLLDRLEAEKREAEKQAMTSGHMLSQLEAEMGRVQERLETSGRELRRLAGDRAEQEELMAARQADIGFSEQKRATLEQEMALGQERLSRLRHVRDLAAQSASERATRVATLEERHRSAHAVLQRIDSLVSEMRERANSLRKQIESASQEKEQRETENLQIATQLLDLDAERNAGEAREGLLQFESEQIRGRLAELE